MNRKRILAGMAYALGLVVVSCEQSPPETSGVGIELRPIADCTDLEQSVKLRIEQDMREQLEANRSSAFDYRKCCSGGCWYDGRGEGEYMFTPAAPPSGAPAQESASEYTTTNNQVVGVDEADFVKNDGSYIYLLSGEKFLILDAWPAQETRVISETTLDGRPQRLFVEADRAVVYADMGVTYCYGAPVGSSGLKITVLDISDRSAPRLTREIELDGNYVGALRRCHPVGLAHLAGETRRVRLLEQRLGDRPRVR